MNVRSVTLLLLCSSLAGAAWAAAPDHWVGTWAASPMVGRNSAPPPRPGGPTPPPFEPLGSAEMTFREVVHVSIGGPSVRIAFTNEFGAEPLTINAATLAVSSGKDAIQASSLKPLFFDGKSLIVIPAGAYVLSDAVAMNVAPLSDLAISFGLPAQTISQPTVHQLGNQTIYTLKGSHSSDPSLDGAKATYSWQFLKGVDVMASVAAGAIVTLGDSITDGAFASRDQNARWPDELARRLHAEKSLSNLAVLNQGISGNRVLRDGAGVSALTRFGRDAIEMAGVRYIIIMEGINDIGVAYNKAGGHDVITSDELIGAYKQMVQRAHDHGIKVIGATLTPYGGAGYASPAGEQVRTALNGWMRTTKMLDGLIDFDRATRDPAHPDAFLPANDHGDHLHPGDVGYKTMGDSIDLKLFR